MVKEVLRSMFKVKKKDRRLLGWRKRSFNGSRFSG